MHLTNMKVRHEKEVLEVDFIGDDGDRVTVQISIAEDLSDEDAIDRAREIMVQLTAFGTRGGGRSVNRYDALSNGNFDDHEPLISTRH